MNLKLDEQYREDVFEILCTIPFENATMHDSEPPTKRHPGIEQLIEQLQKKDGLILTEEQHKLMMSWILGNDTGASSQSIWGSIMGIDDYSPSIPHDADDFGRCWRLLSIFNREEIDIIMTEVAEKHQIWKPYANRWEEFEELFVSGQVQELSKRLKNIRSLPRA